MDIEIEKALKQVYKTYMQKYIGVFDKSGGLVAMSNNTSKFTPIFKKFTNELVKKANTYLDDNNSKLKDELTTYCQDLTLKFGRSLLDPFE